MNALRMLPAIALAALVLAPSAANAQAEQALMVRLEKVQVDESALENGRLPPGVVLDIWYSHAVTTPPATICPMSPITIAYSLASLPAWASASLSVSSQAFFVNQQGALLGPQEHGPFQNTVSIVLGPEAPSGAALVVTLLAKAFPAGSTLSGCNLKASETMAASVVIVAA